MASAGAAAAAGSGGVVRIVTNDPPFCIPESPDVKGAADPLWDRLCKLQQDIEQKNPVTNMGYAAGKLIRIFGSYVYPPQVTASSLVRFGKEALAEYKKDGNFQSIQVPKVMGLLLEGLVDDANIQQRIQKCWTLAILQDEVSSSLQGKISSLSSHDPHQRETETYLLRMVMGFPLELSSKFANSPHELTEQEVEGAVRAQYRKRDDDLAAKIKHYQARLDKVAEQQKTAAANAKAELEAKLAETQRKKARKEREQKLYASSPQKTELSIRGDVAGILQLAKFGTLAPQHGKQVKRKEGSPPTAGSAAGQAAAAGGGASAASAAAEAAPGPAKKAKTEAEAAAGAGGAASTAAAPTAVPKQT